MKRQEDDGNRHKVENQTKDYETFSTPKIVAEPETEEERKLKKLEIKQREQEDFLKTEYLDPIEKLEKLSSRDLAVIDRPDYYPSDHKKDRRYNKGVQRAKNDLKLSSFLLESLKPHYRQKILSSDEFNRFFEMCIGASYYISTTLTQQEKDRTLVAAIQLLGYSLYVIKRNMPREFHKSLNALGLPFATLIDSISIYARDRDRKVPQVRISEYFIENDFVSSNMIP